MEVLTARIKKSHLHQELACVWSFFQLSFANTPMWGEEMFFAFMLYWPAICNICKDIWIISFS